MTNHERRGNEKMQLLEKNEKVNYLYIAALPIVTTYIFELKKQWKKFVIFSMMAVAFVVLLSYLPYALIPDNPLPETQADYFQSGLNFLILLTIFSACFFFSGIICAEFGEKTGYITFPIINKYKLVVGKYLGGLTLNVGVIAAFYFTLGVLGIYYYGAPINYRYYYSFGIALLYLIAVSSFVTFFSSFLKSVNMTIVTALMILLIGNMIADSLVMLLVPDFEPIYSLNHASDLISYILVKDFPTTTADRYEEVKFRGFTRRIWLTPTIEMGITIFLLYTVICLTVAAIIFKRRQL
jgi:ABC-type transport system involved in multi-copper enzyme maturation permease subunit